MDQTQQRVNRLEELTQASLQILEHFQSDGTMQENAEKIRSALEDQRQRLAECRQNASQLHAAAGGLKQRLSDCERLCAEMEQQQKAEYKRQAGGSLERFESKPLDDQLKAEEAYHDKIDYKSLVKLRENIGKMIAELQAVGASSAAETPSLTAALDEDETGRLY